MRQSGYSSLNQEKKGETKDYNSKPGQRQNSTSIETANLLMSVSKKLPKTKDGEIDLGILELQNRIKFGVKKPANIWRHEMDDTRITGDQFRLNNFKSTMFDGLR